MVASVGIEACGSRLPSQSFGFVPHPARPERVAWVESVAGLGFGGIVPSLKIHVFVQATARLSGKSVATPKVSARSTLVLAYITPWPNL